MAGMSHLDDLLADYASLRNGEAEANTEDRDRLVGRVLRERDELVDLCRLLCDGLNGLSTRNAECSTLQTHGKKWRTARPSQYPVGPSLVQKSSPVATSVRKKPQQWFLTHLPRFSRLQRTTGERLVRQS
jgi:hypothetical protein